MTNFHDFIERLPWKPGTELIIEARVRVVAAKTAETKEEAREQIQQVRKPLLNMDKEENRVLQDEQFLRNITALNPSQEDYIHFFQQYPGVYCLPTATLAMFRLVHPSFSDQDLWNLISGAELPIPHLMNDLSITRAKMRALSADEIEKTLREWKAGKPIRDSNYKRLNGRFQPAIDALKTYKSDNLVYAERVNVSEWSKYAQPPWIPSRYQVFSIKSIPLEGP